ncbi:actin interacting protein 3, partial [Thamnocephalis sphaerospora]
VRLAYGNFRKETADVVGTLEQQCSEMKAAMELERVRQAGSARAFITESQKDMNNRTEAVFDRIEDVESICEEIKRDITQRRAAPSEARMNAVRDGLREMAKDINELKAHVEETQPRWKRAWEEELQAVVSEQQFLKEQVELMAEQEEDYEKLMQLFGQLEKLIQLQATHRPKKQAVLNVVSAEEGYMQLNNVMQEITCIAPDSERRLKAMEQAEKMRRIEQAGRVDEFEQELGNFVTEKKLRPTGGFEEAERLREVRRKNTMIAMLSSKPKP